MLNCAPNEMKNNGNQNVAKIVFVLFLASTGSTCGGHCCDNATEEELTISSSNQFANNLRMHTQNLRRILDKTAETFRGK